MLGAAVGICYRRIVPPPNSHPEVLTPRASERDLIWGDEVALEPGGPNALCRGLYGREIWMQTPHGEDAT